MNMVCESKKVNFLLCQLKNISAYHPAQRHPKELTTSHTMQVAEQKVSTEVSHNATSFRLWNKHYRIISSLVWTQ